MENVIVTTPDQLRAIIAEEIGLIIPQLADLRRKNEPIEADGIDTETAVKFLAEQGIPTTRSGLYNLVYKNAIPHRKFGRRTIFSKKELVEWIASRTVRPEEKRTAAALRLAANLNRNK